MSLDNTKKEVKRRKNLIRLLKSRNINVRVAIKNRKDKILSFFSMMALFFSTGILVVILSSVIFNAYKALTVTKVLLSIEITNDFPRNDLSELRSHSIELIHKSLENIFKNVIDVKEYNNKKKLYNIVSNTAHSKLANYLVEFIPSLTDDDLNIWIEISGDFNKKIQNEGQDIFYDIVLKKLKDDKRIKKFFNKSLFIKSNSRVPENAGILGALVGSILTIVVCLLFALPLGVMSGICLSELLPRNMLTNIIEITINNLAAVPSIIFGILGFTVYLGFFDIPRASSFAGGITLSLMMLPNLIIATKHAFSTVPNSVKNAAFALGASKMAVIAHHSFAIALPTIIQGMILSVARILGESSPLLMIGMVAFIVDVPKNFLDPVTVLPVQIYIWASNPDTDFIQLAAVAIIALLLILLILNLIVSFIRRKFDYFIF